MKTSTIRDPNRLAHMLGFHFQIIKDTMEEIVEVDEHINSSDPWLQGWRSQSQNYLKSIGWLWMEAEC